MECQGPSLALTIVNSGAPRINAVYVEHRVRGNAAGVPAYILPAVFFHHKNCRHTAPPVGVQAAVMICPASWLPGSVFSCHDGLYLSLYCNTIAAALQL